GWPAFAALAYPACFMRCAESLGFSLMTLAAGTGALLCCRMLFMGFTALSITASTFVGNALGAGDARQAKVAALASVLGAPLLWLLVALVLLEPHSQAALIALFTDGSEPNLVPRGPWAWPAVSSADTPANISLPI
ncbi:multidrug and toxic compound extrusion protein, partial [Haematococcus lacustris]